MGVPVWFLAHWLMPVGGTGTLELLMDLAVCMIVGVILFIAAAAAVKAPELDALKQLLAQRTQSR
jgi:hypothetical protein